MDREKAGTALAEPIRVNIFNQTYSLRSHSEREHVERIARLVDERMRQIASQAQVHDVVRVAILAALNIADELESLRRRVEEQDAPPEQAQGTARDDRAGSSSGGAETAPEESGAQSWYEDLFDARTAGRRSDERLSRLVSSKLQMLRQPNQEPLTIEAEGEGD